jgi:predicted transcriptional regulator
MKAKQKALGYKPTNIRLPIDLHSKAEQLAKQTDRNLSQMLTTLLREALQAREATQ